MCLSQRSRTQSVSISHDISPERGRRHRRSGVLQLPLSMLLAPVLAFACDGGGPSPTDPDPGVDGSGNFVTQSRSVSGFNGVSLTNSGTLLIEQTGSESLTITAEDNILPLLRSDVVGGQLILGPLPGDVIRGGERVYELTVRNLNEVSTGTASTVEFTRVDTPHLDVNVAPVTAMTITGSAGEQDINISGPSSYEAAELQSRVVRINATGPSRTTLRVSRRLEVTISLPAVVEYIGNPVVSITGDGEVQRVGD